MRRLAPILLAILFAASACFGAPGTWRCANGMPCVFTAGVGYHCPGDCPASRALSGGAESGCSRCRKASAARAQTVSASKPCALSCGGCRCRFDVSGLRAPVTTPHAQGTVLSAVADHAAVFPPRPCTEIGYTTRPVIFTTGPPDLFPADVALNSPSRAPPRLPAS